MSQELIEELAKEIEQDKVDLAVKKQMLKAVKRQSKQPKLFAETKAGRACIKALAYTMSGPYRLHQNAMSLLTCPKDVETTKLERKADSLLQAAKIVVSPEDKKAQSYSAKAMSLLDKAEKYNIKLINEQGLRALIDRLRSEGRQEALENLEQVMEQD